LALPAYRWQEREATRHKLYNVVRHHSYNSTILQTCVWSLCADPLCDNSIAISQQYALPALISVAFDASFRLETSDLNEKEARAMTSLPLPSALSLAERRICVTGAASGIGRATAHAAVDLGAMLLLNDMAPLSDVQKELEAKGAKVDVLQGDLTEDNFAEKLIAKGPIHGLAHCAGILGRTPLQDSDNLRERFSKTMDVNVRVPIELGLAFTDHMAENGGGSIVMIGSVAGRTGGTALSTPLDYSASKGAVHVIIRWLSRHAVGRNVLINGVAPGPIQTAMTAGSKVDAAALPRGRMGEADEIAWLIMMLLTPAASYVSGAVLDCNGGSYVG
jgi:3-oxoacyl-[acyl-carrier protein] reductase